MFAIYRDRGNNYPPYENEITNRDIQRYSFGIRIIDSSLRENRRNGIANSLDEIFPRGRTFVGISRAIAGDNVERVYRA